MGTFAPTHGVNMQNYTTQAGAHSVVLSHTHTNTHTHTHTQTHTHTHFEASFLYSGADKSLARPGRKQATATKF